MRLGPSLHRAVPIPARHLFFGVGIAAALGTGFWLWSRTLPSEYVCTALLSYETSHSFLADPSTEPAPPTVQIAEAVLPAETIQRIADQVKFTGSQRASNSANDAGAGNARVSEFQSHLELTEPARGLLQVTFRGTQGKQVVAATNAVAGALAAWVPRRAPPAAAATPPSAHAPPPVVRPPPPVHPAPRAIPPVVDSSISRLTQFPRLKAATLRRQAAALEENAATQALQQQGIERRILTLIAEEKALEGNLSSSSTAASSQNRAQLASVVKQLGPLRLMRATLVAQQESEARQARLLKAQAAAVLKDAAAPVINEGASSAPAKPPPAPVVLPATPDSGEVPTPGDSLRADVQSHDLWGSKAAERPEWQGAFTVVAWGEKPLPLGDERKEILLWVGVAIAIAALVTYLGFAARRFRPISNSASLRDALRSDVKYFGAVAGSPLTEKYR